MPGFGTGRGAGATEEGWGRDLGCLFQTRVCSIGVDVYGELVESLLRDGQTFDSNCLEINLAVNDALAEGVPASPLDDVHATRSNGNGYEEDSENNDEKNPETREVAAGLI